MDQRRAGRIFKLLAGTSFVLLVAGVFVGLMQKPAKSAVAAEERATRFITVAGTGRLEEESGKFFVRASCKLEVALGAIDENTFIVTHSTSGGLGRMTVIRNRYLGQYVTVIAIVEVEVDNETVFRPVHTDHLTIFRHSDGLPRQSAS